MTRVQLGRVRSLAALGASFVAVVFLAACGDDAASDGDGTSTSSTTSSATTAAAATVATTGTGLGGDCAAAGATSCNADGMVLVCEEQGGRLVWGTPRACEEDAICREEACSPLDAARLGQADAIRDYAEALRDRTGYTMAVDFASLVASATKQVYLGDGSAYVFARAMYAVFRAVPQGHAAIGWGPSSWSACSDPDGIAPLQGRSWYGVCARSADDAAIVTSTTAANQLGLAPGDRVVGLTRGSETWSSPGFLDRVAEEPICDGSKPSESARRDYAATNVFGILREGDVLHVQRVDGSTADVIAPARGEPSGCWDPLDRPEQDDLFATHQRADGVVAVILPSFFDHPDHPFPDPFTLETYRDWVANAIDLVKSDLAQYAGITGIVWDIRGNGGGSQEYAMGLLGSMGDTEGALANCYARIPASQPPAFETESEYPFPYQIFADQPLPTIGFTGKQAVLVDGMAISAADWMVHQAKRLGIPIVGHGAAAAYGYTTGGSYVDASAPPVDGVHDGVLAYISGAACYDATGAAMEGDAPVDLVVDFTPADLAAGVDTQLEAAAALLLQP